MIVLFFALGGLVLSCLLSWWLQGPGRRRISLLDHPGSRSLHTVPTPRTGGVAIALGWWPAGMYVLFEGNAEWYPLLVGWVLVFAVSFVDDVRGLPFWVRLPIHFVAASLVVLVPDYSMDGWLVLASIFWIVWGTNLFNFMDGMDGLSGSMAVIGGASLAVVFLLSGQVLPALLAGTAAGAAAGFLFFNFPPARIFMGDAGSAPLGFLFAALAVRGVAETAFSVWLPLLIFLPFIADATLTLLWRACQRKPIWKAHREHAYQRLVLAGYHVRKVLLAQALIMVLCAIVTLSLLLYSGPQREVLLLAIFLFTLAYSRIIRSYSL